jgi:hypothetical protein
MQCNKLCCYNNVVVCIAGGMMSGIAKADQFILFLSDQCMSRPFVQHEVREAIKLGRKVGVEVWWAFENKQCQDFNSQL